MHPLRTVSAAFVLVAFALTSTAPPASAHADTHDDALARKFLDEGPNAWAAYEESAKQFQGRYSFDATYLPSKLTASYSALLKRNSSCRSLETTSVRTFPDGKIKDDRTTVLLANPRYAARLVRPGGEPAYVLADLLDEQKRLADVAAAAFRERFSDFEGGLLEQTSFVIFDVDTRTHDRSLTGLLKCPGFRVLKSSRFRQDGFDLARVEFETSAAEKANGVVGGTLVLEPAKNWCLHSYEIRTQDVPSSTGVATYRVLEWGKGDTKISWSKRSVLDCAFTLKDGTKGRSTWRYERDLSVPSPPPGDAEFRLAAYGLPEPPGVEWRSPTPWWLYVTAAGLTALGVGVVFTWLRRRASKS